MTKKIILSLLLLCVSLSVWSQAASPIELTIRYYDKAIYFRGSAVFLRLELYNNSADTVRFRVADRREFNLDFSVRTLANRELDRSERYVIERSSDRAVFYREITLEPGERYGFVTDLSDFVVVEQPGVYVVQARFFPELYTGPGSRHLASNLLTLTVYPDEGEETGIVAIQRETGQLLQQMALPPDEVVRFMLQARQRSQWERFFLYLDVEALYREDPARDQRYRRLSDAERRAEIARFRSSLQNETTEDELLLIPSSFEILRTTYTPTEAQVIVLKYFEYPGFTERKQFTYYLRRRDDVWIVYNYAVQNLGTQ